MAETLKWVMQLKNELSPAAAAGAASLVQLQIELRQTAKELTALEKASHGLNVGKGILGALSGGLSFVGDIAGGLFDAAASFGKMALSGAAFREDTVVGFETMLGSAKAANQLFDGALSVAQKTKFETRDVVGLYSDLLAGGFKVPELNTLVAGLADVGTALGTDKMKQFEHALMKIQSQGKLTGDSFQELTLAGVNGELIKKQLALALGIKEKDTVKLGEKVMAAMKKGAIGGAVGIGAALDAVTEKFDKGGPLGTLAKNQSATLSGVYSNFKEAFSNLFMSKETAELPAIAQLKKSMLLVSGFFDTSTEQGQRVLGVVNRLVEDLLGMFSLDPGNASGTFARMLGWLESFERGVRRVTAWIGDELLPTLGNAFSNGGLADALMATMREVMSVAGSYFMAGIFDAAGMTARASAARRQLEGQSLESYQQGKRNGLDRTQNEMANFGSEEGAGRGGGAPQGGAGILGPARATGGGGDKTTRIHAPIHAPITINGATEPEETGKAVADHLHRQLGALNRAPSRAER